MGRESSQPALLRESAHTTSRDISRDESASFPDGAVSRRRAQNLILFGQNTPRGSITRNLFFPIFFSDFGKPLEKKNLLKKN
jgi:hypothetical protein